MKNIFLIFITFSLVGILASCKKQLNQQPTDTFSDENAFQSLNDIQLGTNAAYERFGTYTDVNGSYPSDMYASAVVSDEGKLGLDNAGQGALTYRYQYSADLTTGSDVIKAWGGYYRMLDQINRVLGKINEVPLKPGEEARKTILNGQLLALRGIAHFELLRNYADVYNENDPLGVPIMLKSDPLGKPKRNTVKEVMNQIDLDLSTAKGMLPNVTAATFTDTVMNKINIAAYQARIALYKRDYDNAIKYSTEVINSNVKPLADADDFPDIWTDESDKEILFKIRYANSPAIGNLWNTTAGQIYIAPSDKLVDSYDANDVRLDTYIGTTGGGYHYVKKFLESSRGVNAVDMKAARISEMYLIRAEAYAKSTTPNITAGAADLNLLRSKRISGYADETFSTAEQLIAAVLQERFKELCFEGFRFYDLKRNNLPVQRLTSDANPAWQTLPADSYLFVFPIPQTETNANPNMEQNPKY